MSEAYYNEVVANLTWYQLNSDFKDPIYQYMVKIEQELYKKIKPQNLITYYETYDDFVVALRNDSLQYGSYQCSARGKEAYMDSVFSCFLFQLPFFLENIQIGYIGFVFVLPIMLISIFGGIKESYKWFILNQTIWDAFLCYDFICSKPTLFGWSKNYSTETTCFYRNHNGIHQFLYTVLIGFRIFLRSASFIPVFHLALSRFLAMYFPIFYKKFTKNGYKILIFILIFNIFCITIFAFTTSTTSIFINSLIKATEKCNDFCLMPSNISYCFQNIPKYFQCINKISVDAAAASKSQVRMTNVFKYISYFIPPIMFFLSVICAGFLFYKITSQLKFQLKTNPDSFKQTIKISSVVGFQCLTMSVIFVITVIQKFMLVKSFVQDSYSIFNYNHFNELPPWLFLLQNYTTTTSLNMIRILLDSCIILTVLSGYSKCVILTFKFLWLCFLNPKEAFKKMKYKVKGNEITVLSVK